MVENPRKEEKIKEIKQTIREEKAAIIQRNYRGHRDRSSVLLLDAVEKRLNDSFLLSCKT
jgi:hypothetical protein